jgi:transposase
VTGQGYCKNVKKKFAKCEKMLIMMNNEYCKNCPLIEEIAKLRAKIEELEKKLEKYEKPEKNSGNSSLPPSSDKNQKFYPLREKSGKKQGGQIGHKGYAKIFYDNPDEIVEIYPKQCNHCGCTHFIEIPNILEQRQVVDIPPIKPVVIEYQQKAGICSNCGQRNVGEFPLNISPNVQIGSRTTAIISYFNVQHHLSYERLIQTFKDIFNFNISKGSIDNKIKELSQKLTPAYDNILENLKNSSIIGSDETGVRVNNENSYVWAFQNRKNTYFKTAPRSFQTIQETIGEEFGGSWVSDRNGAQLKVEAEHQLCLVHLLRNCKYIIEAENSRWAKKLKKFLKKIIEFRKQRGEYFNPLSKWHFRQIQKFKKELLQIFAKSPPKQEEKRLYKQLLPRLHQLTHFLDKKDVPYDNNGSERALRNRVINRKIAGCFRSTLGATCHDIISSVIETAKKRGLNILDTLNTPQLLNQLLLQP